MMSLTFGLFTQVSGSGPLGPLVLQPDPGFQGFTHVLVIPYSENPVFQIFWVILVVL